jgi:polar amino acid transport system permease protein
MSFDWPYFWSQLVTPSGDFVAGLELTVLIAVLAQLIGIALGLVLAQARLSTHVIPRQAASLYIWVIRGVPLLVQIVFIYTGLAAAHILRFNDIQLGSVTIPGNLQAAILALGLHEAAYMAETFRAGIGAVDRGQIEAAKSLGMPPLMTLRFIVLPQALRVILLPIGNQFNIMLKNTTLVSVIGVSEMVLVTQNLNSVSFRTFELYAVLGIYYLALTTIWSFFIRWAERKLQIGRKFDAKASAALGSANQAVSEIAS